MHRLLIRNIKTLVSCDAEDRVYENVNLYCEDGLIRSIGPEAPAADEVLDASHMLCYPGLVNTHHHLYQVFSRNLPQVQNMELFDWLTTLYEIWKGLRGAAGGADAFFRGQHGSFEEGRRPAAGFRRAGCR